MNAHIPQSYEAATELAEIAAVPQQIISPRFGKPVIGAVQDTLVGSYRITRPNIEFNRREFMNLMMWNRRFEGQLPKPRAGNAVAPRWTGQQVVSQLLPPINLEMTNGDQKVVIREGEILSGTLDKTIFSKPSKGIVHVTYNDYGPKPTVDLLDALQNTIEQFLVYNGFSVGISDLVADAKTKDAMEKEIRERKKEVEDIILQLHMDLFENNTGKSNQEEFEAKVYSALNKANEKAGNIGLASLADENRLTAMVRAGSKGSNINIAQMVACVGQIAVEGRRIPYGFTDRTLPHYKKYDDGAEARGFAESSFIRGLTPQEFFFHAMSGREGLIDTAVKTADTGYIQRQLVKAMEDLTTQFDGTVRDAKMNILQFHYGEDGVNSTKIEAAVLGLAKLSDSDIRQQYGMERVSAEMMAAVMEEGQLSELNQEEMAAFAQEVIQDRNMLIEKIYQHKKDGSLFAPVNIERILYNLKVKFGLLEVKEGMKTNLTPSYVLAGIRKVMDKTLPFHRLWCALLRFHCAPHKLIMDMRFNRTAFDTLCEMLVMKNWQSWAQPGEQVGILAAQSIGEPATQMSCVRSTWISTHSVGPQGNYTGEIGTFIDKLLKKHSDAVVNIGDNSVVLDLPEPVYILGVSTDEKTAWKRISQVSRHPVHGGLVRVHTKSGRNTTATLSHSFLKRSATGIVPVLGSDLKVGDRIPIARRVPCVPNPITSTTVGNTTFKLDREFGWICGIYLADGSFNGQQVVISKMAPVVEERLAAWSAKMDIPFSTTLREGEYGPSKSNILKSKDLRDFLSATFGTGSYNKKVGTLVYNAPLEFIAGVVGGFWDGDGNVNAERQQIRAGIRNRGLLQDIARLLGYCGIFGVFGSETTKAQPDKAFYTLNILKKYAPVFQQAVGLNLPEKAVALAEVVKYVEREEKHASCELYDKIPEVGAIVAETGRLLKMAGQSRTYGRWAKKESVGRLTLESYCQKFREQMAISVDEDVRATVEANLALLESAVAADVVWDEIVDLEMLEGGAEEMVYDFTVPGNDSFMVDDSILVHNTLNSVDWDTEIMIAKNGRILTTQIGEFIDEYYNTCEDSSRIQRLPNNQIYIDLNDGNDWKAISCDDEGRIMWTKLEAITRHPVVNDDGTDTILEVETKSGRKVKATKGKSFLTPINGKITATNGSDLKIGDVLPIGRSLAMDELGLMKEFSLRTILPPTEWLYGSEAKMALAAMKKADESGIRHWFQSQNGSVFQVPYNRSDTFRDAFEGGRNSNAENIQEGCVYTKRTRPDTPHIPERLELNEEFGFMVGAYLAEGSANTTQINITNNNMEYLKRIENLLKKWNVGSHTVCEKRKAKRSGIEGTSTSIIIHSTLLAKVFTVLFGRISSEKTMPDWVFQSPKEFVAGLLDGYISGDGTVAKKSGCITLTSVSEKLITRISTLMARFGIFSTKRHRMPEQGNFENVQRYYTLYIPAESSHRFAKQFTLTIPEKQSILDQHFKGKECWRRGRRQEQNHIIWDPITAIKEVKPIHGWVYDLTVEKTRNFMTLECLGCADTFHLAGVAAKSNMTRGVPRLKELLKVTQNPKATALTVFLKPEFRGKKEKAREVAQDLELTLLRDICVKAAIYYDPSDETTILPEDRELIKFYRAFESMMPQGGGESKGGDEAEPEVWSKWMLRLELDRERMFNKNISMDDIAYVLKEKFSQSESEGVRTVYSDFNSSKLIMRIRIMQVAEGEAQAALDDFNNMKKFQNKLLNTIVIRGVPGIKSVLFRKQEDFMELKDGKFEPIPQYVLETDGSNFLEVMNHPAVDGERLVSSHVHDIYENLGIEATRAVLLNELSELFEEAGVNFRHLGLLCDVMVRAGRLMSVDRYGINKMDIGPLAKASFEETERILLKAAVFGEVDPVTGTSANIMMGQPLRSGTSFSQILLDEKAFMRQMAGLPPLPDGAEDTVEAEEEGLTEDQIDSVLYHDPADRCSTTQLKMNIAMPPAATLMEEPEVEMEILEEED